MNNTKDYEIESLRSRLRMLTNTMNALRARLSEEDRKLALVEQENALLRRENAALRSRAASIAGAVEMPKVLKSGNVVISLPSANQLYVGCDNFCQNFNNK